MSVHPPVRTPSGARWDCHACGDCCRLYELGPVEPEIVRGLEARRIEDHWAPAAEAPWYEVRRAPDGREAYFLTHRDGHCVFLKDDNLCAVHGLFGAAAKPAFCREFPFHELEDPKGLVAVVRPSCKGWHGSFETGRPVAEQTEDVLALPRVLPRRKFAPEAVAILPDVGVPLGAYMTLEEALLADLEAVDDPEAMVARLRARIFAAAGRAAPAPDARRARLAAGAVVEGMRRVMAKVVAESRPGEDVHRVAFARKLAELLEEALPRLSSPAPLSPRTRAWMAVLLRTFVLAKGFQAMGGVAEGLGVFLLQAAIVRAVGSDGPDVAVEPEGAGDAVVLWTKLTENQAILGVLRMARPALIDLFAFAPATVDVVA